MQLDDVLERHVDIDDAQASGGELVGERNARTGREQARAALHHPHQHLEVGTQDPPDLGAKVDAVIVAQQIEVTCLEERDRNRIPEESFDAQWRVGVHRVVRAGDDDYIRLQQWFGRDRVVPGVQWRTDQQIQLALQQCFGKLCCVCRHHFQADPGPALVDFGNDAGEQQPGGCRPEADSNETAAPGGHALYFPGQPLCLVGEGCCPPGDEESQVRWTRLAATAVEQRCAELVLEVRNPIAQRGLRDAQHRGRLAQAAGLADHPYIEEVPDVHARLLSSGPIRKSITSGRSLIFHAAPSLPRVAVPRRRLRDPEWWREPESRPAGQRQAKPRAGRIPVRHAGSPERQG